jgi:hypothetical protein
MSRELQALRLALAAAVLSAACSGEGGRASSSSPAAPAERDGGSAAPQPGEAASPTAEPAADKGAEAPDASEREADAGAGEAPSTARAVRLPGAQTSDAELRLLTRARRALLKSPVKALALTVDHQRAFKDPRHAERRELIAIEALVRLGRGDEARARARAFYAAFPGSGEHGRVRGLVAGPPR